MTPSYHYKTLTQPSSALFKEKGSKFIGLALPCTSEEDAKVLLERIRKEHYQATHVCYAYRLGWKKDRYRANDDGEPSNSAGAPILGQILSFDLTNILIAVVRYYGGTKLGVGGLITAYKNAAHLALSDADIIQREVKKHIRLLMDHSSYIILMRSLKRYNIAVIDQEITEFYAIEIAIPMNVSDEFLKFAKQQKGLELKDLGFI